ncbi:MAG: hypothetical protein GY863_01435 [bacterium]|nr:hypothetical protein [bacterium]
MKKTLPMRLIILSLLLVFTGFRSQSGFPVLKGLYLGQNPPGIVPELFAPDIFSKTQPEWAFDSVFSQCGNEFYFTQFDQEKKINIMMCMKRVSDKWTKPEEVSFNGKFNNNNLCISPDGFRIFFKSWRPLPGNTKPEKTSYIWYVHRTNSGWSEAQPVNYINKYLPAGHPSVSNDGTLYFRYRGKDDNGNADTHLSNFVNGSYSTPVNLGSILNTEYIEGDVCVAPDESFIIVACWDRPDNSGESDLYISFRDSEGEWSTLKNMGRPINTELNENNAMLSPDGKYLFFMRVRVENEVAMCDTYWVDSKIIETLRPIEIK